MTTTIMVQFDDEANILGELDGRFPIPIAENQHAESVEISHAEMHTICSVSASRVAVEHAKLKVVGNGYQVGEVHLVEGVNASPSMLSCEAFAGMVTHVTKPSRLEC
jgi:hypothetical protein